MDPRLLEVFQKQVTLQVNFANFSAQQINAGVKDQDINTIFFGIQNLLNAAANIAKALWGGGGKRAEQRKPLRDSIGIDDNSPLKVVSMRHNFEHIDERLDTWWQKSTDHNYVDLNVGAVETVTIVGNDEINNFRRYDAHSFDLLFWGEKFNIREIMLEVQRITPILQELVNKSRPDQAPPKPRA
jgi:hypothetical protein